jgi:hypothetical protein
MGWDPAQCVNLDGYAYAPVIAGSWQQYQLFDGTYIIDDLLDWHEMATVKAENQRRHQEWMKSQNG